MFKDYEDYKNKVDKMMNGNHESYKKCIEQNLVKEKEVSTNGEPYRFLREEEFNEKFPEK